jgi:hypothetical protein
MFDDIRAVDDIGIMSGIRQQLANALCPVARGRESYLLAGRFPSEAVLQAFGLEKRWLAG